jgi:hypothetical protein
MSEWCFVGLRRMMKNFDERKIESKSFFLVQCVGRLGRFKKLKNRAS